ncbi:hypothetical protein AaE_004653 [Aphanomyces astaci]|uniref:Reverse transcriptase domain-containing protein n=1 Tax=Aphanomyces astaci TaxID=112090 RepID=A0A6A5A488_APHAT|nr:hypothetical protein AaE_004653 [Aphanomyces astaci]
MDDICVFSRTIEEHVDHLRSICTVLRTEKLYARPSKCSFGIDSVNFLGHTISKDGLHVDQSKVRAIEKWPEPQSSKDVMSFVGLASYYRKFIPDFAELVRPLSGLEERCQVALGRGRASSVFDNKVRVAANPCFAIT